jgi:hypothetical protein
MSLSIIETDAFHQMEQVADLMIKLDGSETKVAREMGIPRKTVLALHQQYKDILIKDSEARDYARDHLYAMVKHYDKLISRYYVLLEDLENLQFHHLVAAQISGAIKGIADLEKQRVDALQKAGILEGNDLGDELAAREDREAIILDILRNDLCAKCRNAVATKLTVLTNRVEPTMVYEDVEVVDEGHAGSDG